MSRPWPSLAVLALGLLGLLGGVTACSGSSPPQRGPNYSKTPCFDNCGANVQCQLACQGVDNGGPPPFGVRQPPAR